MQITMIWHFNFISRLQPGHFPCSCLHFEKSCDKIAQPDWLTLVAISSDERKKLREQAHLVNAREFNHRCLACQISAILYADCGNWSSLHRAHLAIFANRCNQHIKLAGVSPALPVANFNGFNIKVRPQYINICIQIKSSLGRLFSSLPNLQ